MYQESTTVDDKIIFIDYIMKFDVDLLTGLPIKPTGYIDTDKAMRFVKKVNENDIVKTTGKPFSVARDIFVKELENQDITLTYDMLLNILDVMHLYGNQFNINKEPFLNMYLTSNKTYLDIKFNRLSNKQIADVRKKSTVVKAEQLSLF